MDRLSASFLLAILVLAGSAVADDSSETFFETKIRPVLATDCLPCHGGKKTESGLKVDSRESLLRGGDRGPAIVAGEPEKSLLVRAIRYTDRELKMPPKRHLPAEVATGVRPVGRRRGRSGRRGSQEAGRSRGLGSSPLGISANQGRRASARPDRRVQRGRSIGSSRPGVRAAGLRPVRLADRRTLIRRVTFDLIGLPPTPEEVADFEHDDLARAPFRGSSTACSPRRTTANAGAGTGWTSSAMPTPPATTPTIPIPEAARYRDYIIDSFNRDKPFDQFVREQLAGDILARQGARRQLRRVGGRHRLSGPVAPLRDRHHSSSGT